MADGQEQEPVCPWQRHYDDTGTVFYYNETTEESEWDIPPGWEEHFASLDSKAGLAAEDGDASADAAAVAVEQEQQEQQQGEEGAQDSGRETAEKQQVDDAAGAEALLGLAQTSTGQQVEGEEGGVSPPTSPPASPMDVEGQQAEGAGSSVEDAPAGADVVHGGSSDGDSNRGESAGAAAAAVGATCPWIQSRDEESGDLFYYNEITEESSWDEPAEYTRFHAAAAAAAAADTAADTAATAEAPAAADSDSEEEYYQHHSPDQEGEGGGREDDDGGTPSPHYSPYSPDGGRQGREDEGSRHSSSRSPSPRPYSSGRPSDEAGRGGGDENNSGSPSPETGLSFPAFGDDYSPAHEDDEEDWRQGADGGRAAGSQGEDGVGGSAPFGESMSPGSEGLGSGGAVGGVSPLVDNHAQGEGGRGKENSAAAGGDGKGKAHRSEADKKKMLEDAEREVAECERRVRRR